MPAYESHRAYAKVDSAFAQRVAGAFEAMAHDPQDPRSRPAFKGGLNSYASRPLNGREFDAKLQQVRKYWRVGALPTPHPQLLKRRKRVKPSTPVVQFQITAKSGAARELCLSQIGTRLGFALTTEFMRQLGFEVAGRDCAAVFYNAHDFSIICPALVNRIGQVH